MNKPWTLSPSYEEVLEREAWAWQCVNEAYNSL